VVGYPLSAVSSRSGRPNRQTRRGTNFLTKMPFVDQHDMRRWPEKASGVDSGAFLGCE
jgi:hypothetical protein